ncbi:uncharacterized protein LAJ45_04056 [Morchella importuna]|uniref:uncharacterized protein n=1 Tax=Morchella importuna TaxID=1174673 RepID=UPI001E8CE5E1|nr:uncharacterized protein LAJ45_04056 [Morchella importuna]KAH8152062.1 hypothetical protein LAJ45_04056 [Morchella importuna]
MNVAEFKRAVPSIPSSTYPSARKKTLLPSLLPSSIESTNYFHFIDYFKTNVFNPLYVAESVRTWRTYTTRTRPPFNSTLTPQTVESSERS